MRQARLSRPALAALALLLAVAVTTAGAQAPGGPAELTEATVVEREGAVEVWVRLSRAARYQSEFMDGPFRLVLDFEDTAYRWSVRPVAVGIDPVRELRGSQFRKGVARLVIEVRRQVAYTIEQDAEGLRIVLARQGGAAAPRPPVAATRPAPAPRPGAAAPPERRAAAAPLPTRPLVYGIVMLDERATAYIFDPSTRQVRRFSVGDALGDSVVETIGERHVVLKTPTGRLELRVDDSKPDAVIPPPPRR